MNTLVIFVILLAVLFSLAYFTKRRFGVLGLALCAGMLLSAGWSSTLTPWLVSKGLVVAAPPMSVIVSAALIVLPSLLLLFSGPTYHNGVQRIVGSLAFAALGFVFLLGPIGEALTMDETGSNIYSVLSHLSNAIVVVGIIGAIVDILMTRTPHRSHH